VLQVGREILVAARELRRWRGSGRRCCRWWRSGNITGAAGEKN
jgi:hypothetical protein